MNLIGAKLISICNLEADENYNNSIFANKLILEKDGEQYLVEAFGEQVNVYKE